MIYIQQTLDITDDMGTGVCRYIRKSIITEVHYTRRKYWTDPLFPEVCPVFFNRTGQVLAITDFIRYNRGLVLSNFLSVISNIQYSNTPLNERPPNEFSV